MSQHTDVVRGYNLPTDHFTIVPNAWIRDRRLSRRARGLLIELMSHRPGWRTSVASLSASGTEGEAAIKTALRELRDAGYLRLEWTRDERGRRTGSAYIIQEPPAESPQPEPPVEHRPVDEPAGHTHEGGFRPVDNPPVDQPPVANLGTKKNIFQEEHLQEDSTAAPRVTAAPEPARDGGSSRELADTNRQILADLEHACRAAGLRARFDRVSTADRDVIAGLVAEHGTARLTAEARALHRPDDPARFAQAWIPAWLSMPAPRKTTPLPVCTDCDHGWLNVDADIACPTCRPNLARRAS